MNKPTVIDIFCGAGGFSEGFRQQGFDIVLGIDSWRPAIKTFNYNYGLDCLAKDVRDFSSVEEIDALPDTDVIIGSPPCVTFSHSNRSGKADKSTGVQLTEVFLRIVAVKKFKPHSKLNAWFMENVANSVKYLRAYYTFEDLNLAEWAEQQGLSPEHKAIILEGRQPIINSADYGAPQRRKRVMSGEFVDIGELIIPAPTHRSPKEKNNLPEYISLGFVKKSVPKPNAFKGDEPIIDPLYSGLELKASELSDHFYDTGLYACDWKDSKFLKTNHPYMGKMSFPEDESKPSRTITATNIGSSREAIIYQSEYARKGDGEYRMPTVRESACIMGFPITYQFFGSEGIKIRLVGNAVCPPVSHAFAKQLRKQLGLKQIKKARRGPVAHLKKVDDLSNYVAKIFAKPPQRKKGSRFRRHPFKDGNITVTLSNYDIELNQKQISTWMTSVQYGNGKGFPTFNYPDGYYQEVEPLVKALKGGEDFLEIVARASKHKLDTGASLQEMYECRASSNGLIEPTELVKEVGAWIDCLGVDGDLFIQNGQEIFKNKKTLPVKQLFALYAINKIATIVNRGR